MRANAVILLHRQLPDTCSRRSSLARSSINLGHENRTNRELPCPRLPCQLAQIAPSGLDRGTSLQQACEDYRGLRVAHNRLRLLPGAWTDPQHRPHDRGRCEEVAPVPNPALGVVDNVRASGKNHSERIDPFRNHGWLRIWLRMRWQTHYASGPEMARPAILGRG